jgi:hypothetical protein
MYIGKTPTVGNFQVCDAISVVNGQAAYTLQVGGVNVAPESANHMLVSLNGILQKPGSSFTISGSTMTFASNLATGDVIDFVQILGNVLDIGQPSDDTVTAAKLNNDIISGQTALTAEPADTDEFLVSDAGTLKRIDYSLIKGGGITEADQWRLTAGFSSAGDITSNLERVDTDSTYIGTGMTQSSGIFTFPSTGLYWIIMQPRLHMFVDDNQAHIELKVTTDNSSYATRARATAGENESGETRTSVAQSYFFDVTNTSTHKVKFALASVSTTTVDGDTDINHTSFTFIRLGDT